MGVICRTSREGYYMECNKANRGARDSQVSSSTEAGSSASSVVSSKKLKGISPKSVAKNVSAIGPSSAKAKSCGSSKKDSGGILVVKKPKKNLKRDDNGPTVHHKIGKLF